MSLVQTAIRPAWLLACVSAAAILGGASAQAADFYGSGGVITNRPCPAGATNCSGVVRLQPHQYFGGYGSSFSASSTLVDGASAGAGVSFGDEYLPVVKVGSFAGEFTRTGASATAFRSFTYNGDVAIDLAINGMLHFFTSGDVVSADLNEAIAGDGTLNVVLSLQSVNRFTSVFNATSAGVDIVSNSSTSFPNCGETGVIAVSEFNTAGLTAGEYDQAVGLNTACGGGAITLNPGDSFVVAATLQAISNRYGFLDALNTFTVQYDEEHTYLAGTTEQVGEGFLARNVAVGASVPEPGTWALMIMGFGTAGVMLRRRRPAPVRVRR